MKTYRIINLEEGHPLLADALARLRRELRTARAHQIKLIKLIHGYGSSGPGGRLRVEVRRELDRMAARGYVGWFITGERLSIFDEDTRRAIALCAELRGDPDLDRHNNGVTLVVLAKPKETKA